MNTPHIATVGTPAQELEHNSLAIDYDYFPNLSDLLRSLSMDAKPLDAILLSPLSLQQDRVEVFELVHSITLLYKAIHQVEPRLAIAVDEETLPTFVRACGDTDLLGMVPLNSWFGIEHTSQALDQLLKGHNHWPRKLMDHFFPPRNRNLKSSQPNLTPRQQQVLHMIAHNGASNKMIARSLKLSESTVKLHISCILKKFGVRSRTQLALCAQNQDNRL